MSKRIFSIFDCPPRMPVVNDEPSLTLQQAAAECDINLIVERYAKTGSWTSEGSSPRGGSPSFGDFTDVADFMTAQNAVIEAQAAFDSLPAKMRKRFDNDPASLLTFLGDPSNKSEAITLGLVDASEPIVSAASDVLSPQPAQLPT
nr:MAG: internal scaffolding protein [Microvirus sp.]